MATLTALSLLAGSAALVMGVNAAKSIEKAPPPEEQLPEPTVEKKPAEPVLQDTPVEPVIEDKPVEEDPGMAGGAIGRPKWGVISSSVIAPQDTALGATVSNALGIREDPRALNDQIILVERQLEAANFTGFVLKDRIAKTTIKYQSVRKTFAEKFAESKNQELTAADYLKKLNNQGNQNQDGKKALNKIISDNSKSQAERDEAKRKLAEMSQPKDVDEITLGKWRLAYTTATAKKIEADDDKTDAERDKNKYFAELTDLRTKQEEQEKLVKELLVKRNALLTRLQAVLEQKKKKEIQPVDMPARTERYAKAVAAKKVAEENLRRFYSNTWLPLEGQPSQSNYQGQFTSLQTIWRNTKAEVELAQAALTAPAQVSTTDAEAEFAGFASEIVDLTRDAVDRNGQIKTAYAWEAGSMRGYPSSVKTLKDYATKPKLRVAANVYYEIANMDSPTLVRNVPRFLSYFKKLKGTVGVRSEREKPTGYNLQGDVTNVILREFVARVLELAANDVRLYPSPDDVPQDDPPAIVYSQLRDKTNEFVDKQIYLLNKMFRVIKAARKTTKLSNIEGKNLLELEEQARELYPIHSDVPPKGQCERLFKPATFAALSTGIFKGKKILEEVLEDPRLKDEFLDEIGFIKVSNFLEAKEYAGKPGTNRTDTAILLLRKAAFGEYNRKIQQEAFNDPTANIYHINSAQVNSRAFSQQMTRRDLLALDVSTFADLGAGDQISNQEYARQLGALAETSALKFVPGVFLEAARLAEDGSRDVSVEPLVNFRNACELDGNVGQGSEQINRITDILDKLTSIEVSTKQEANPLLTMIKKLEDKKKIDITRRDQAEPESSLAQHGFTAGIGDWAVMKVTDDKKLNFVETFLTFRSSKFRSIPYNDTTVYGGKTVNTREIYAKLALTEIEKMPSFDSRSKDDKESFPADADWQRLSDDFHLNFVIYRDNKGRGIADRSAAGRPNAPVYNVFKAKNGRYYPIRMNAGRVGAPGNPAGVGGPQFPLFNRGVLGGAIEGVTFRVDTFEPEETTGAFLDRTVGQPVKRGTAAAASKASEIGRAVYVAVTTDRGVTTYVNAKANEYIGQPLYKFVDGVWKKLTEEEEKDYREADPGVEEAAERARAAAEARAAQERRGFVPRVIADPTPEEISALKAKLIEISGKPRGFTDDQTATIFKILKFNLTMKNVGKDEFRRIIQQSGINQNKILRTLVLNLHSDRCSDPAMCRLIYDRVMAMYGFKNDGGDIELQNIYSQVIADAPAPAPAPAPVVDNGAGTGLALTAGRRKTTTNWRRSKPARYTRRKF